jgi:hypothetical protein
MATLARITGAAASTASSSVRIAALRERGQVDLGPRIHECIFVIGVGIERVGEPSQPIDARDMQLDLDADRRDQLADQGVIVEDPLVSSGACTV